jgi:hypothetical protein
MPAKVVIAMKTVLAPWLGTYKRPVLYIASATDPRDNRHLDPVAVSHTIHKRLRLWEILWLVVVHLPVVMDEKIFGCTEIDTPWLGALPLLNDCTIKVNLFVLGQASRTVAQLATLGALELLVLFDMLLQS